jgi:rhodanese-related sulfurtransferase
MKKISLSEYNSSMGILIDVRSKSEYDKNPVPGSINIYEDKLIVNHNKLLDKSKKYYIICEKGFSSRRVVSILELYGYDVTQVIH